MSLPPSHPAPDRGPRSSELSRRDLVAAGAGLGAAVIAAGLPDLAVAARRSRPVFRLDPARHAADHACGRGCTRCVACNAHARHRLFPSASAADRGRAHAGCLCQVRTAGTLPIQTWTALFGRPGRLERHTVDTRWPWVRAMLRGSRRRIRL